MDMNQDDEGFFASVTISQPSLPIEKGILCYIRHKKENQGLKKDLSFSIIHYK